VTPIIVHWTDAHADPSGGWVQPGNVDQRAYTVTSIGWLMPQGEGGKPDHVSICQSRGVMAGDDDADLDHVLHVPCGMVTQLVVVG